MVSEWINQPVFEDKSICFTLAFKSCVYILLWQKTRKKNPFHCPLHTCHRHSPALAALSHLPTCFCGWQGHRWLPGKELLPHFLLQLPAAVSNFLGENGHIHSSLCIKMKSSSTPPAPRPSPPSQLTSPHLKATPALCTWSKRLGWVWVEQRMHSFQVHCKRF